MVVALTVTPALALILLRKRPTRAPASPRRAGCSSAATAPSRADRSPARWAYGHRRRSSRLLGARSRATARSIDASGVQGARLPDALGDASRDIAPGDGADHDRSRATNCAPSPGVRNFGAHIGQAASSPTKSYGIYFGENWISVDPAVDYDTTLAAVQEVVDGYPGLFRDVQTYLKERIREVLDGIVRRDRRAHLRPGPRRPPRTKAEEVEHVLAGIDGVVEPHVELQVDIPQLEVEVDLATAHRLRHQARRRPPRGGDHDRERGGRRPLTTAARRTTSMVWSTPGTRQSVTSVEDLLIDTADGGHVQLGEVAAVRLAPTPNDIERDEPPARHRRRRQRARPRPRLGRRATSRRASGRSTSRSSTTPRCSVSMLSGRPPQRRLLAVSLARRSSVIFLLLQASFGSWRLAILSFLTLPIGAGRWRAGGLAERRHYLARIAGRLPDRAGHRGAQRDHADQSLPAPGARRRRAVRP